MNICMVTGTFHPKIGGGETYARTMAEGMCRAGHNVIVLTDGFGYNWAKYERLGGIEILRASAYASLLDDPDKVRWEQMYFGLLNEFCSLLGDRHINIVHANSLDCAIIGSMLALSLHVPLVCSFHEQEPEKEPFGEGKCKLVFSCLPVNMFLAGSKFYFGKALACGAEESRVRLVYHGVNLTKFFPQVELQNDVRSVLGVRQNDFFIVCAGRLKQRKGLIELVRALHIVRDVLPNIQALIVGSCNSASRDYANKLYQEIQDLGLMSFVRIDENLKLDDMPSIYKAADLIVQPSFAEGLGLALLEAMASGKPVIGTTIPGIQEIITHEQNGLLVPPGSVEPLAEAIVRIATKQGLAQQLVKAGLAMIKSQFDIERTVQETENIFFELVQEGNRH